MDLQGVIDDHKRDIQKKTCTVKELAEMLDISETKARQLTRMNGFPILSFGRNKRILLSKLDDFLEELLGLET